VRGATQPNTGLSQALAQTQTRPSYAARVGFEPPPVSLEGAQVAFREALRASPDLSRPENRIQVVLDGSGLILRGSVQTDRDRDLAVALAGLTPGVRFVRSEL